MQKYYELLRSTSLFRGISDDGMAEMLECFHPNVRDYRRGELILLAGYENSLVGILLEGEIEALKSTPGGTSVCITRMGPGGIFGDVLSGSCARSPVTVAARTDCRVLFLPYSKIIHPCAKMHVSHSLLLQNLVAAISDKYFALNRRMDLLILKSLRAKLCVWLLDEADRAKSDTFTTPLSRAGLANYLNCERSALSRELGRMRREGLLETYKNSFRLLDRAAIARQSEP